MGLKRAGGVNQSALEFGVTLIATIRTAASRRIAARAQAAPCAALVFCFFEAAKFVTDNELAQSDGLSAFLRGRTM